MEQPTGISFDSTKPRTFRGRNHPSTRQVFPSMPPSPERFWVPNSLPHNRYFLRFHQAPNGSGAQRAFHTTGTSFTSTKPRTALGPNQPSTQQVPGGSFTGCWGLRRKAVREAKPYSWLVSTWMTGAILPLHHALRSWGSIQYMGRIIPSHDMQKWTSCENITNLRFP
jgi:hypothetical protein